MNSRDLVDPDFHAILDKLPSFSLTREAIPTIRANFMAAVAAAAPPPDANVVLTERTIAGPAGEVRLFVYRPAKETGTLPVFVHFHGGGYIMGAPSLRDARSRYLAMTVGCVVVSVQYRLAPEYLFPTALQDGYAALTWVHANASELNVDRTRIAIGGESAGGGLTASLAQMARDRAEVPIKLQILSYPMLDNRTGQTNDCSVPPSDLVWDAKSNQFCWKLLLGEDNPIDDPRPYAVPGRCKDLSGLPPAFIAVGAIDLLADENIDYAKRLIHAGIPTELHVYPGAFHGFDSMLMAWSAQSFVANQVAALQRAFRQTTAMPVEK